MVFGTPFGFSKEAVKNDGNVFGFVKFSYFSNNINYKENRNTYKTFNWVRALFKKSHRHGEKFS